LFVAELPGYRATKDGGPTANPNIADSDSVTSVNISMAIMEILGSSRHIPPAEDSRTRFEEQMRAYLLMELKRWSPPRIWTVDRALLWEFEQYRAGYGGT
jgi:hypothetical protein